MFDLQLFNEDAVEPAVPDVSISATETESASDNVAEQQTNTDTTADTQTAETENSTPDFAIVVDEFTGQRKIVQPDKTAENNLEEIPAGQSQEEAVETTIIPYTAEDLVGAMTTGSVDESRIPANLKPHYAAIQAQQQLAYQKQMQQQTPPVQAPVTEQPPAEDSKEQVNPIDVYKQIQKIAEAKTLKDLGMTAAQYEEIAYNDDAESISKKKLYDIAMTTNVQSLLQDVAAEKEQANMVQVETNAALQEMIPVVEEYRKDPHFAEIDHMMQMHYMTLPYNQATKIAPVLERLKNNTYTRSDLPILDEYYKASREAFYSKLSGVSKTAQPAPREKPPIVENAGGGGSTPASKIDFRQMRTMDARQRSDFLRNALRQNS